MSNEPLKNNKTWCKICGGPSTHVVRPVTLVEGAPLEVEEPVQLHA